MQFIKVTSHKKAQEILDFYQNKAKDQSELDRLKYAKELCRVWQKEDIDLPLPAVPARNDYWYLVQLYFLKRHVHADKRPYLWDIGRSEEIYTDDFGKDKNNRYKIFTAQKYPSILGSLLNRVQKKSEYSSKSYRQYTQGIISRKNIDMLLSTFSKDVLSELEYSPNDFKIVNIPFDIYLRLAKKLEFAKDNYNIHFDGYRLRLDGQLTGLYGGDKKFGGPSLVDSIWTDVENLSITTKLIIVRKDYGY